MSKISYEHLALEDAKLFTEVKNISDVSDALDEHNALLEIHGWTVEEYEKETLLRIDLEWTAICLDNKSCLN